MKVAGYRPLEKHRVEVVNENKALEELILRQIDTLMAMHDLNPDPRWIALAKTHLEIGFMALNRSVFQPERIGGELDVDMVNQLLTLAWSEPDKDQI